MPEKRKHCGPEFREGAGRIVEETRKPIAAVARDLGCERGTLGNWVNRAREAAKGTTGLSKDDVEDPKRLRGEVAELRMERDVLKRSVVLRVEESTKCVARFSVRPKVTTWLRAMGTPWWSTR